MDPDHFMECYLALDRNKVLTHAGTWISLDNIRVKERSQVTKGHTLCKSIDVKCPGLLNPQREE